MVRLQVVLAFGACLVCTARMPARCEAPRALGQAAVMPAVLASYAVRMDCSSGCSTIQSLFFSAVEPVLQAAYGTHKRPCSWLVCSVCWHIARRSAYQIQPAT